MPRCDVQPAKAGLGRPHRRLGKDARTPPRVLSAPARPLRRRIGDGAAGLARKDGLQAVDPLLELVALCFQLPGT